MGGHAYPNLKCPRIPPDVYLKVKQECTTILQTVFKHVVVPTEMPEKDDYGDVDFLVSHPLNFPRKSTQDTFPWDPLVRTLKTAFGTPYGRHGFLVPDCMFFAVPAPDLPLDDPDHYWVQVDVKVCFDPDAFEWERFLLNYASAEKILGSMGKPLGITINPDGMYLRVEGLDLDNFAKSMIWVSREAKDVLRLFGLDWRLITAGFESREEIYEYFASSWVFDERHFAARLEEERYVEHLGSRSHHWIYFIQEWIPARNPYPKPANEDEDAYRTLEFYDWYDTTRAAVRDKVLTMFPHAATEYHVKRAAYEEALKEYDLKADITKAIPKSHDGWQSNFPQARVIIKDSDDMPTPEIRPSDPWEAPLYLSALSRDPPFSHRPRPPPEGMSDEARLACLERWTAFDTETGALYVLNAPNEKPTTHLWTDAVHHGATEDVLLQWAKEQWWCIWTRQSRVNYVGMWNKRFEKEDKKMKKERLAKQEAEQKEQELSSKWEQVSSRLDMLNARLLRTEDTEV